MTEIQSFDDSNFQQQIACFRAYLQGCRDNLKPAASVIAAPAPTKRTMADDTTTYQATHVYVLQPGSHRQRGEPSLTRKYAAPVWISLQDEQDNRKRRKVA